MFIKSCARSLSNRHSPIEQCTVASHELCDLRLRSEVTTGNVPPSEARDCDPDPTCTRGCGHRPRVHIKLEKILQMACEILPYEAGTILLFWTPFLGERRCPHKTVYDLERSPCLRGVWACECHGHGELERHNAPLLR